MKLNISIIIILLIFSMNIQGQKKIEVDNGYEKGTLVDGYKNGLWSYYDNDTLKIKIDYSTGKLIYLKKDTSEYAILTDDGWKMSKLKVYPHYLGSNNEIEAIFYNYLKYPIKAMQRNINGTVLLGFEINLQGKVDNVKIIKDIGYGCGDAVLEVFKKVPDYWLVARKGDKKYKSRYVLPVHFKIGSMNGGGDIVYKKDSKKEQKKLQKAKEQYFPARYFPKIVISAVGATRTEKIFERRIERDQIRMFPYNRNNIYR